MAGEKVYGFYAMHLGFDDFLYFFHVFFCYLSDEVEACPFLSHAHNHLNYAFFLTLGSALGYSFGFGFGSGFSSGEFKFAMIVAVGL